MKLNTIVVFVFMCISWTGIFGQTKYPELFDQYIAQAIAEYRFGFTNRALFQLRRAQRQDAKLYDSSFDAQKLTGLLFLKQGKKKEAALSFQKAVELRADPFLFYFLGLYNLQMRDEQRAASSFRGALEALHSDSRLSLESESTPSILATSCGEIYALNVDELPYDRTITELEVASARFVINSQIKKENLKPIQTEVNPVLKSYLENPMNDDIHRTCLQSIDESIRREKDKIALGNPIESREKLTILEDYQRLAYRLRYLYLKDERSLFAYGTYLQRQGSYFEALYIFRKALSPNQILSALKEIENKSASSEDSKKQLNTQVEILRYLAKIYSALGRKADETSVENLAKLLERKASMEKILDSCGENLNNRESLVILAGSARNPDEFKERLAARDVENDDKEFLTYFRSRYVD